MGASAAERVWVLLLQAEWSQGSCERISDEVSSPLREDVSGAALIRRAGICESCSIGTSPSWRQSSGL